MAWTAKVTGQTLDPSNGNILLTFQFTSSAGLTQTRTVPSSTWTPASINAYAQSIVSQLEARDVAAAAIATGAVALPQAVVTALQNVWGTTTLPTGVTGTAFVSGDTLATKLPKLNAWTVKGPNQDVPASSVAGYLALNAKLYGLQQYAKTAVVGAAGATQASVVSANELVTLLSLGQPFQTSQSTVYAAVQNFLAALVSDPNTGITATDEAALLALAATTSPWWQSIGASAPISVGGATAAGLS